MHTHTHVHMHTHTHVHTHMHVHVQMHMHTCMCVAPLWTLRRACACAAPRASPDKQDFALEAGGALRWAALDDKYCISFVFRGAFAVALRPLDAKPPAAAAADAAAALGEGAGAAAVEAAAAAAAAAAAEKAAAITPDASGRFHGLLGGSRCALLVKGQSSPSLHPLMLVEEGPGVEWPA